MDELTHEMLEIQIAREVSAMIALGIRSGLDPKEVAEIYFAAVGASMAILYSNATASNIYKMAGGHTRQGFLQANVMDFGEPWKPIS